MYFYKLKGLFQKEGFISPAFVGVNECGLIEYLSDQAPDESFESIDGYALPGFQNAHSHAFQYSMAGLAENHPEGVIDDFWTWREAMYHCALSQKPEQIEAIAAALYAEMLRLGYTHVAEFHYLHHDQNGMPYANLAEMGERIANAAQIAGIKLTLIPIFYQRGGFGLKPAERQRRFISNSADKYLRLLEATKKIIKNYPNALLGFGVHSLRAVLLPDIISVFQNADQELPFHMHIAEQKKEVSDCQNYCGKRPVELLFENLPVNQRFNLVHATHLSSEELTMLAKSQANVVLCPSTEANLGDGIFALSDYVKLNGQWSIGSDSQIGLNPIIELRTLDYLQRLISNKRNALSGDIAAYLLSQAFETGKRAMGQKVSNNFELAKPFDAVIYDDNSYLASQRTKEQMAATILYTSDAAQILGTIVKGKWVVKNHQHINKKQIKENFAKAIIESRKCKNF